jgi:hypothetical protein
MKQMCYHCKYRGEIFRINNLDRLPYCHCENEEVLKADGYTGWGTLRVIFDVCNKFKKR